MNMESFHFLIKSMIILLSLLNKTRKKKDPVIVLDGKKRSYILEDMYIQITAFPDLSANQFTCEPSRLH